MRIFKDLTYYSYSHFENAFNIGWVELDKKIGDLYECSELIDMLLPYLEYQLNKVRSISNVKKWNYNDEEYILGFSEFRIISENRVIYAVPDTILYSIKENGYRPPTEFLNALCKGMPPNSDEYKLYLSRYNLQDFWGATDEEKKKIQLVEEIVKSNDVVLFSKCINKDISLLDVITSYGSVLNFAIKNNKEKIALEILNNEISITKYDGLELITAIENNLNNVAEKLIDMNIPMRNDSLKYNPLFIAIAYKCNDIAVRLFLEHSELKQKYTNEFVKDCDLLQWCASCNNIEMFSFIKENSQKN